jgi:hypothetical protein
VNCVEPPETPAAAWDRSPGGSVRKDVETPSKSKIATDCAVLCAALFEKCGFSREKRGGFESSVV